MQIAKPFIGEAPEAYAAFSGINALTHPETNPWDHVKPHLMKHLGIDDAMESQRFQQAKQYIKSIANNPHVRDLVQTPAGRKAVQGVKEHASTLASRFMGPTPQEQRLGHEAYNALPQGVHKMIQGVHGQKGGMQRLTGMHRMHGMPGMHNPTTKPLGSDPRTWSPYPMHNPLAQNIGLFGPKY